MLEEQHENFVAAVRKWDMLSATKGENERQWKKKRARKWRIQGRGPGSPVFLDQTEARIVSLAAVFSIVTQRLWGGALRDDTKNGCEGD